MKKVLTIAACSAAFVLLAGCGQNKQVNKSAMPSIQKAATAAQPATTQPTTMKAMPQAPVPAKPATEPKPAQ